MNILKSKPKPPAPFIPTVSHFAVPGHRKMRGKRYKDGKYVGPCGPPKPVPDPLARQAVIQAHEDALKKGPVREGGGFDLNTYRPLPGRILVTRGRLIKELGGVALPEDQWHYKKEFIVVRIGEGVTSCDVGDRVMFGKGFRPAEVELGTAKLYLGRDAAVVAILETPI